METKELGKNCELLSREELSEAKGGGEYVTIIVDGEEVTIYVN